MLRVSVSLSLAALLSLATAAQSTIDLRILRRHELPSSPGRASAYAFGDLDGDGRIDVYISGRRTRTDNILLGCPGGGFRILSRGQSGVDYASDDVKFVDVDRDGDLDIVTVAPDDASGSETSHVRINDGHGVFQADARLPALTRGNALAVGDVDGTNGPDLFIGQDGDGENVLLLNDGNGHLHAVQGHLPTLPAGIQSAALFDADNDGDLDLVVAQMAHASSLLLNDGTGRFSTQPAACFPSDVLPASGVATGDIDCDGDADIVFAGCQSGALPRLCRIMRNLGGGCFQQEPLPLVTENAMGVCLADLDGDGDLDLAFACAGAEGAAMPPLLLGNDGCGSFSLSGWIGRPVAASAVAAVDVDDDGDLELWVGSPDHDHWYASYQRQLDAPLNPEIGMPYRLALSARVAQTVPTSALLFIGTDYVQPRFHTDFGGLGVRPDIVVALSLPPTGEVTLEAPWATAGTLVFQALILPNNGLTGARLTNVVGDTL